jgi:hypothetical protein
VHVPVAPKLNQYVAVTTLGITPFTYRGVPPLQGVNGDIFINQADARAWVRGPDPLNPTQNAWLEITKPSVCCNEYTNMPTLSAPKMTWGTVPPTSGNPGDLWISTPSGNAIVIPTIVPGVPGSVTPPPANLAQMRLLGQQHQVTGQPWTVGQYVVLGDTTRCHWDGYQWAPGAALPQVLTAIIPGQPGTYQPNLAAVVPNDLAALQALGAVGQSTPWTAGQYIVLGNTQPAYWDGAQWQLGIAPVTPVVTQGSPGTVSPVPFNLASLQAYGSLGQTTAWPPGSSITLGNGQQAHWNGSAWVAGPAPTPVVALPAATVRPGAPPGAPAAGYQVLYSSGATLVQGPRPSPAPMSSGVYAANWYCNSQGGAYNVQVWPMDNPYKPVDHFEFRIGGQTFNLPGPYYEVGINRAGAGLMFNTVGTPAELWTFYQDGAAVGIQVSSPI